MRGERHGFAETQLCSMGHTKSLTSTRRSLLSTFHIPAQGPAESVLQWRALWCPGSLLGVGCQVGFLPISPANPSLFAQSWNEADSDLHSHHPSTAIKSSRRESRSEKKWDWSAKTRDGSALRNCSRNLKGFFRPLCLLMSGRA